MNTDSLSLLGASKTKYPDNPKNAILEVFENPVKNRPYIIRFSSPEFTSLCPITGQPDFGNLIIDYIPESSCVESKALKLFLFSFRNHGAFHEQVTNEILDRLVDAVNPKWMRICAFFFRRGGLSIDVFSEHGTIPEPLRYPDIPKSYENGRIFS